VVWQNGVAVYSVFDSQLLGAWAMEGYEPVELVWSPDGRRLAVRGHSPSPEGREALFLIEVK
jgi:hypothetical protein